MTLACTVSVEVPAEVVELPSSNYELHLQIQETQKAGDPLTYSIEEVVSLKDEQNVDPELFTTLVETHLSLREIVEDEVLKAITKFWSVT